MAPCVTATTISRGRTRERVHTHPHRAREIDSIGNTRVIRDCLERIGRGHLCVGVAGAVGAIGGRYDGGRAQVGGVGQTRLLDARVRRVGGSDRAVSKRVAGPERAVAGAVGDGLGVVEDPAEIDGDQAEEDEKREQEG
jgi:hypothetical protein